MKCCCTMLSESLSFSNRAVEAQIKIVAIALYFLLYSFCIELVAITY